jgi:STE24 endopeptidase
MYRGTFSTAQNTPEKKVHRRTLKFDFALRRYIACAILPPAVRSFNVRSPMRSSLRPGFILIWLVAIAAFSVSLNANAVASPSQGVPQLTEARPPAQGYTLPPDRAAKAIRYAQVRRRLYFVEVAYEIVLLLLFLRWRVGPSLRNLAERAGPNRFLQALVFAPLFQFALGVLTLPDSVVGHWLSRVYGQSIQSWPSWLWDWIKSEALTLVIGTFLIWLLYVGMRASPRRWWFYAWLASLPIIVVAIFLVPLVVEPMFFHFEPLAASRPELASQLERVVMHAGQDIPESRMYVMDASGKLNTLNAYVTGLGASRRVVVWDTTIAAMTTAEILFVFGHEMGHYVLGHIRDGIIFAAGLLFFCLFAGFHAFRGILNRWGATWGIRGADDWASLPILFLLLTVFSFLIAPIDNAYSRHLEHQADQYGLEVVHGIVPDVPDVAAQSFQILGDVDLEEPSPSWLVKIWFYDHPPISERIDFARSYNPWAKGESPEFVH